MPKTTTVTDLQTVQLQMKFPLKPLTFSYLSGTAMIITILDTMVHYRKNLEAFYSLKILYSKSLSALILSELQ